MISFLCRGEALPRQWENKENFRLNQEGVKKVGKKMGWPDYRALLFFPLYFLIVLYLTFTDTITVPLWSVNALSNPKTLKILNQNYPSCPSVTETYSYPRHIIAFSWFGEIIRILRVSSWFDIKKSSSLFGWKLSKFGLYPWSDTAYLVESVDTIVPINKVAE